MPMQPMKFTDRMREIARTNDPRTCWNWPGACQAEGYGITKALLNGKFECRAHRAAYIVLVGPIPEGLDLDHLCRNPRCVNPSHLEPVTRRVNVLRGYGATARNARKTHCKHGHALTSDNIYWKLSKAGNVGRQCKACTIAFAIQQEKLHPRQQRRAG